jgi:hypothetical protein
MQTLQLSDEDLNTVLAALIMARCKYDTNANGGIHYDFTFKTMDEQNIYAVNFGNVDERIREQLKTEAI